MSDPRIVYGVRCTWWDSIDKVGALNGTLPCCPFCGSTLFEVDSIETWMSGVEKQEQKDPGYKQFILWLRGKCFINVDQASDAYAKFKEAN